MRKRDKKGIKLLAAVMCTTILLGTGMTWAAELPEQEEAAGTAEAPEAMSEEGTAGTAEAPEAMSEGGTAGTSETPEAMSEEGTAGTAEAPEAMSEGETEQDRKIRIGYIDYDGFIDQESDGDYTGYGVEYLEEIAKYTNWEYEYVYDSWENHLKSLKAGEIDFVCHAQRTPEREENYLFSKYSIGAESSVLYVALEDDRYYYNDFSSFDGMKIAMLQESFQNEEISQYAQSKGFGIQKVFYDTPVECFEALDNKEVDAVAMGSLAIRSDYKVICRFGSDPFYFMAGKNNQAMMEALDDALGQITAFGSTFQNDLYDKYYGDALASLDVILTREEAKYIERGKTVTVAFIPNRMPFSYVNEDGEITGITVDIMDSIAEHSGLRFEYTMMEPGQRTTDYMAQNPDHLVAGVLVENPMFLEDDYLLTDVFYSDDVVLACLHDKEYNLDADRAAYKLAIPASYTALESYIQENYPQFEIVHCLTTEEGLQMVMAGDVDFTAQNVNVIKPLLSDPHYEKITVLPTFFMDENTGVVCMDSEENRLLVGIIDKCIASITDKEQSQFTVDHTLANSYQLSWSDMLYKFRYPLVVIGILFVMVMLLILAFSILRRKSYRNLEEKNRQLAEAVAQANNANRAKSQFLARMSHEIRTPMNAIVGLTALARNRKEEPEQVEEYLDKIETSSKVLLNIINDVLDMSAIESDKIKIAENPFDLREILHSISTVYQTQCRQKGVNFALDMSGVVNEQLIGDGLRLNQILLNLVSNAYKFTPAGGTISVEVKELPAQGERAYFKFTVGDTGEGMTSEMLGRLFTPFEQENADTAQKHGGSGLGLSIAKNLVELMGGSISCQSKKGEGSIFTVSLPFAVDCTAEHAVEETQEQEEKSQVFDFAGKKILMAEDTEINAEILQELLAMVNMQADHAWNGREAVAQFTEAAPGTYEAILMDVQMPEMNGYEAAEAIRSSAHPQAKTIPIYAMTANAFSEDVSAALNAGMNGHIAKPIDTRLLYETLKKVVEGNHVKA